MNERAAKHRGRCAALAGLLACALAGTGAGAASVTLVSVPSGGGVADKGSHRPAISDDGRFVAFQSNATNLVPGDTNANTDVFVRDLVSGVTERVSIAPGGGEIDRGSFHASISDDGRWVAMQSYWGRYGNYAKILVHDRSTGDTLELLPVSGADPLDREARLKPFVSGGGRFVAFHTAISAWASGCTAPAPQCPPNDDTNRAHDVYLFDLATRTTRRVSLASDGSQGNGDSWNATLSDDGNRVAFQAFASNLVTGDTNGREDCFVRTRSTGATVRVSVASDGGQADGDCYEPVLSGNGRFVAFRSRAGNLVPGDTNNAWDIFVHDLQLGTTERVSVASDGSQADGDSYAPDISDDGRFVVFHSRATNLVEGDGNGRHDVFLHDRRSGRTVRLSVPAAGEADGHSYEPAISGDGRFVVFESLATNLAPGDTNGESDIFLVANPLLP